MFKQYYIFPLLIGLAAAACGDEPSNDPAAGSIMQGSPMKMTARPGPIEIDTSDTPHIRVSGTFEYDEAQPGEPGLISEGFGGACLLAPYSGTCTTNKECGDDDASPKIAGYCIGSTNADENGQKRGKCWRKVGDDPKRACNKGIVMTPGGAYSVPATGVAEFTLDQVRGSEVRMITCLNPPAAEWPIIDGSRVPPCATGKGNYVYYAGDPVKILP